MNLCVLLLFLDTDYPLRMRSCPIRITAMRANLDGEVSGISPVDCILWKVVQEVIQRVVRCILTTSL